jgi:hypothetical protein
MILPMNGLMDSFQFSLILMAAFAGCEGLRALCFCEAAETGRIGLAAVTIADDRTRRASIKAQTTPKRDWSTQ